MTILMITAIIFCVGIIGVTSIISIKDAADRSAVQFMNQLCESKYYEMNEYMDSIRWPVDIMAHFLADEVDARALAEGGVIGAAGTGERLENRDWNSDRQKKLDSYLHEYVEKARQVFHSASYDTTNAMTYFFLINPELTQKEPGFLFIRNEDSGYVETSPSNFLPYKPDDSRQVGWYYKALGRGRASWLEPYEDETLGTDVTTYIAPVYKTGTLVGLAGMDMSYDALAERIRDLEIYHTGYAFLTDEHGQIIYHPQLAPGVMLTEVNRELEAAGETIVHSEGSSNTLVSYEFNGIGKKAAWQTLQNGLRLIVSAPESEINEEWQTLIRNGIILTVILLAVFIGAVTLISRHITEPLQHLTEASRQISEGNYDVELPYQGNDEIGILTGSFRQLVESLKDYINDLNSKAYKDVLTSVKNKAAFELFSGRINEEIENSCAQDPVQFAIAMFDCNRLKKINDEFGHNYGDLYLKISCSLICRTFARSPVFRIGGDEFAVILRGEEYEKREELMDNLRQKIDLLDTVDEPLWKKANLAMGMAEYDPALDQKVSSVLNRADEAMYADKREWKEAHGIQK